MNPTTDRFTVRSVVLGLIVVAVLIVVALVVILLTASGLSPENKTQIVTTLQGFGAVAIGAVAGVLAHTASQDPVPAPQPGAPVSMPITGGTVEVAPIPVPVPEPEPEPVAVDPG